MLRLGKGQGIMRFDSTAPADTFGDYAVDHGHADDFYAPSASQLEAEEIRRECVREVPPRADRALITRPY